MNKKQLIKKYLGKIIIRKNVYTGKTREILVTNVDVLGKYGHPVIDGKLIKPYDEYDSPKNSKVWCYVEDIGGISKR